MIRFPITPNVAADLVSLFREGLRRSKVTEGEGVVVYADTLSNPQYPAAFLAAAKDLGANACQIIQPAIPHDLERGSGRAMPSADHHRGDEEGGFRRRCQYRRDALFERAE